MSNIQIGLVIALSQLLGAVTQPFFGIRADRTGGRRLGSFGLAFNVIMFTLSVSLAAATRQYWLMFFPMALAAIGSGALHPVGALHSAEAIPRRSAFNMACFFLMGQLGLGAGSCHSGHIAGGGEPESVGQAGRAGGA